MFDIDALVKISDWEWEVPVSHRPDMQVPVRIFATRRLLEQIQKDRSLEQAVNSATLPGLVGQVIVMPDMHQGYGFPIGGVAATRYPTGVVSPGAIGYDINCGVRLLASQVPYAEAEPFLDELADALEQRCPAGVGVGGHLNLSADEVREVAQRGAQWALDRGLARDEDLARTEEGGWLEGADADAVSNRASERGRDQVGTLGSGNHFLEVERVGEVFDREAAEAMGLREGMLTIMIHTGSRGYGHQICTEYTNSFQEVMGEYGIDLPDRQLACAPMDSPEGENYLRAMRCAANYAFTNRQVLTDLARSGFQQALDGRFEDLDLRQVYDVAHNMGKIEEHTIDGETMEVCVHRKGATRAFGPGHPDLPEEYREVGQPVIIPGSMGTASWVLKGTTESMTRTFGSTAHGAGRTMSRRQAKAEVWGEDLADDLEGQGIRVRAKSFAGLAEEAPLAYKDVDGVVDTIEHSKIAGKVARLEPVAVIKG
jgi:tRNA-splicing ligase RtcB